MGLQVLIDGLRRAGPPPRPAAPPPITLPVDAGIAAIRAGDPSFSEATLFGEVQRIGAQLVAAWAQRALDPCRSLLTDDCWANQTAQLTRTLSEGWRPFAKTVSVTPHAIVVVRREGAVDRVTVRVHVIGQAGTGKVVRGRRLGRWVEDWQLVRTRIRLPAGATGAGAASPWLIDRMDHVAVHLERAA